jgi:hypothetical protein
MIMGELALMTSQHATAEEIGKVAGKLQETLAEHGLFSFRTVRRWLGVVGRCH